MAIILAAQNGNWSATSTWTGGVVPVAGDIVIANNKAITIDINASCLEIRRDTTSGATAGGTFTLSPNLIFNGNINPNGNVANSALLTITLVTNQTATINGNITGGIANGTEYGLTFSGAGGTVFINGNIIGGVNSSAVYSSNNTGIINISGNICYDSNGAMGINIIGNTVVNITGNVYTGGASGGTGFGINLNNSGCIVNITGNVLGNARSSASAIRLQAGTLNITGNVGPAINESSGLIAMTGNGLLSIVGNVYGGNTTTNVGISITSPCTVNIAGSCMAGNLGIAVNNNSTATATIIRAKGNGFGPGSVGMNSVVGVSASQTSITKVYEIEYGVLGQSPTSGPIELIESNSNVAVFATRLGLPKTLVDLNNSVNLVPLSGNVRSGVTYSYGNNIGSCVIPNPSSVVYGVPVDNTIGSGLLSPVAVWNALTNAIGTAGSIGERLKNVSTVSTVGKQLEGVL